MDLIEFLLYTNDYKPKEKKKEKTTFMKNYYDDEEEDGPHWTGF